MIMDIDWLNQNGFVDIAVKDFSEKTYANGNLAPVVPVPATLARNFFLTVTPFLEVTVPVNDFAYTTVSVSFLIFC